jgi:hypothetical protein
MFHALLADAVLLGHLAFIVFAIGGGLLVLWWPRTMWLHLPTVAWAVYVELSGTICPLTPLEQSLRAAAGEQGYSGDFIDYYVVALLYPHGLTPRIQMTLGIALLILNAAIYGVAWRRRRRA